LLAGRWLNLNRQAIAIYDLSKGETQMTPDKILVTLAGLAAIAFLVWFFWLAKKSCVKAAMTRGGYQEAMVLVKGGYTPDVIVVEKGKPVRLNFVRTESASCSEMVLFPDFNKSAHLPEGETVAVEFLPDKVGEFGFQCQMGMLRGKLIVE
jgi:plastocyanin domain-containing protein